MSIPQAKQCERWPRWWWALAVVVIAGAAVRIWAARDDLWLDEVWSLSLAYSAHSPLGIVTEIHHDNNHHLTTLWMYLCGLQTNSLIYRLPSLVTGIGTIFLAALAAGRWGKPQAIMAAVLTACGYLTIVYSVEARGYAMAGFFALAAYLFLDRYLATRNSWAVVGFDACVILGLLSHLTVLHFYAGAFAWSLFAFARARPGLLRLVREMALCHAVPILFCLALYWFGLRGMTIGGGPEYVMYGVVTDALSMAVGGVAGAPWSYLVAGVVLCAAVAALALLWRERADLAIFFAVAIFVSPAIVLGSQRPLVLFVRYFYINILFLQLLLVYLAGRAFVSGATARTVAVGVLALVLVANLWQTADLLREGHGHYREAVLYMSEHSATPEIKLAGDPDFRNILMLRYYSIFLPKDRPPDYQPNGIQEGKDFEWLLFSNGDRHYKPATEYHDLRGNRYDLAAVFPYSGISGFHWAVYHKVKANETNSGH